jgi:hypothetical protein
MLRRQVISTLVLLLFPLLFVVVMRIVAHYWVNDVDWQSGGSYSYGVYEQPLGRCVARDVYGHPRGTCVTFAYAPAGAQYDAVMRQVAAQGGLQMGTDVIGLRNEEELLTYAAENLGRMVFDSVVVFTSPTSYTLISNTTQGFSLPYNLNFDNFFGFAAKAALDTAILRTITGAASASLSVESINLLPGPSINKGSTLKDHSPIISHSGSTLIACSVVVVALLLLQKVATEKREKVSRE